MEVSGGEDSLQAGPAAALHLNVAPLAQRHLPLEQLAVGLVADAVEEAAHRQVTPLTCRQRGGGGEARRGEPDGAD